MLGTVRIQTERNGMIEINALRLKLLNKGRLDCTFALPVLLQRLVRKVS